MINFYDSASKGVKVISAESFNSENIIFKALSYIKWVFANTHLINVITYIELQKTVSRTKLSYLWWLLDPLFDFFCYLFLVMVLNRGQSFQIPFALYIMTAIIPWHFTTNCINGSTRIWKSYTGLIGQIRFPYMCLLLSKYLSELSLYLSTFVIVFGVCLYYGYYPKLTWLLLPVLVLLHSILIGAMMLVFSIIGFVFQDFFKLLPFMMRVWFYVSPAIWSVSMLPEKYRPLIYLNPMSIIFEAYRDLLLFGKIPDLKYTLIYLAILLPVFAISALLFIKKEPYINRYL